MSNYSTSYWDEDEEAPWQALLGYEQPEPAAMPQPRAQAAPSSMPQAEDGGMQVHRMPSAGAEEDAGGGDSDILIAGLLDVVLNRGRNLPQMVQGKHADEDRRRRNAREDQTHRQRMEFAENGMGPRGGRLRGAGGMTPEQLALRQRYADVAEERAKISRDREDRLGGRRVGGEDLGPPPAPGGEFANLSGTGGGDAPPEPRAAELDDDGRTPEEREIDEARYALLGMTPPPKPGSAPAAGGAAGDGMTPYQRRSMELREREIAVREKGGAKGVAAAAAPEADPDAPHEPKFTDKQTADLAGKVWKDTEYLRSGASFLQSAEKVLEKYPEGEDIPGAGTADSLKPSRFLDEDGLAIRQAQQWMNNAIQRADSGAAAPIAEELKFAIRAGANAGASEAEFRAGMTAARQHLQGELSSAAAGRESIARDVYRRQGIEDWVFGKPEGAPEKPPAPAKRTSSAAMSPPAGDTLDVSPAAKATAKISASQPITGGLVPMVDPRTGVQKMVPADRVDEAEKRGLKRVQ
jgi:hypothetical protein